MPSPTNLALMKLRRRAEAGDDRLLVETFVDVGPLFTLLKSQDHQIVYGRRGTGKTHALTYLKVRVEEEGDVGALIDLRTIGSTGGIYSDPNLPIAERGTRLLSDVLSQIHDALTGYVLELAEGGQDVTVAMDLVDRFAGAATDVQVVGAVERSDQKTDKTASAKTSELGASGSVAGSVKGIFKKGTSSSQEAESAQSNKVSGQERHRVHFGEISGILERLVEAIPAARVWVILDEWAAVPLDLQPYLADFLRRALFPVRGFIVKTPPLSSAPDSAWKERSVTTSVSRLGRTPPPTLISTTSWFLATMPTQPRHFFGTSCIAM